MIRIRRGTVIGVRARHAGLLEATVEVDGTEAVALAYPDLLAPLEPGDTVVLNTTAVTLGLGTGGTHFVIAVEGKETDPDGPGHAMKMRYTPSQTVVLPVEDSHREAIDAVSSLDGIPVVAAGLHSAVAPVALGMRSMSPEARIQLIWTDGGALPVPLSDTVPALRAAGLIHGTISAGQSFGGDLEAVSLYGALAAARAVAGADLVIVAMGPGNLGTGSRWGFSSIEVAAVVNAAASMGGAPVVVPRISAADERTRHRGVSHHTLTALRVTLARTAVPLPPLPDDLEAVVREQLAPLGARHDIVPVAVPEDVLGASPVPLRSMGRNLADDPVLFHAAAAAGIHAATLLPR